MRTACPPAAAWLLLCLAACTVGPNYKKPVAEVPLAWKPEAPWRQASPSDALPKGSWWEVFRDAELDRLEQRALAGNQTLASVSAHLNQARALAAVAAAGQYPQVGLAAGAARGKNSADRPQSNYAVPNSSVVQNDFTAGFNVRYEADLFGRVRRSVEAARAGAERSAADLENARLVLTAEVAADYFSLRELDTEIGVVKTAIDLQRRALKFVADRHEFGAVSGLDVAQQQALLAATTTQLELLAKQREQFQHALATLLGVAAPAFTLQALALDLRLAPPAIPAGIPSGVLERRPDVASSERAMAAANAQIGVATAAYFPSVNLMPGIGYESNRISSLLSAPSLLWSLGVSVAQTIFDAGKTRATVNFAQAGYTASVADYRQTVLTAMQEVEDGITGLAALERAAGGAQSAVSSSQRVLDLANDRYAGGLVTYLDVITAQQTLLTNQRLAAQIVGQQLTTTVFLVKALGGGWDPV